MTTPVFRETVATSPKELLKVMQEKMKYKQDVGYTTYNQIIQDGIANCWGAADFAMQVLRDLKIKSTILFISTGIRIDVMRNVFKSRNSRTHAALIFEQDNKYFWFEWAWSKYEGISGPFCSLHEAASKITDAFIEEYGAPIATRFHTDPVVDRLSDDEYLRLAKLKGKYFNIDTMSAQIKGT